MSKWGALKFLRSKRGPQKIFRDDPFFLNQAPLTSVCEQSHHVFDQKQFNHKGKPIRTRIVGDHNAYRSAFRKDRYENRGYLFDAMIKF